MARNAIVREFDPEVGGFLLNDDAEELRSFLFILWEESMPEKWREILASWGSKFWVSPIHNKDQNSDGTPKKPHRHVVMTQDSKMQVGQVCALMNLLGCKMRPVKPVSIEASIQYLVHYNHPSKAQYKIDEIELFGGAELDKYFYGSRASQRSDIAAVVEFCERQGVVEFADLVACACYGVLDLRYLDVIRDNVVLLNSYLRSRNMMSRDVNLKISDNLSYVKSRRKVGYYAE